MAERRGRRHANSGGGGHTAGESSERWLLTYADMITLLLALFILLFAMSTIDTLRFEAVARELSQSFRGQIFNSSRDVINGSRNPLDPGHQVQQQQEAQSVENQSRRQDNDDLQQVNQEIQKLISKRTMQGQVQAITSEKGVVIRLSGDVFFESGSARMNPRMSSVVARIVARLRQDRHNISIEGHTDGQPIHSAMYPSNWELSGARAVTIARFMMARGVAAGRVSFTGFADTRPLVKPPFRTANVRQNRRVEIILKSRSAADGPTTDPARPLDPAVHAAINPNIDPGIKQPNGSVIPTIIDLSEGTGA